MKVEVTTRYRPGVKDIQGMTVSRVLSEDLGFPEVKDVWIGQLYHLEYPDEKGIEYAKEMCERQLVNTVLYDYKIRVVEEFGEGMAYRAESNEHKSMQEIAEDKLKIYE